MKLVENLNILQRATQNKLIKTDKQLPFEMKKVFGDIKSMFAELSELAKAKKEKEESKPEPMMPYSYGIELVEDIDQAVWLGGGCLSELFIEDYQSKPKDMDIFVDENFLDKSFQRYVPMSYFEHVLNEYIGPFEKRVEQDVIYQAYSHHTEISHIFSGYHRDFPELPVEIIVAESPKKKFDLTIREFYCIGDAIFATQRALEDIKNKKISLNNMFSPISTIVRSQAFAKRYGFTVDSNTYSLALKYLKSNYQKFDDIVEDFHLVVKYKDEFNLEKFESEFNRTVVTEFDKRLLDNLYETEKYHPGMMFREIADRIGAAKEHGIEMQPKIKLKIKKPLAEISNFQTFEEGKKLTRQDLIKAMQIEEVVFKEHHFKNLFGVANSSNDPMMDLYTEFTEKMNENGYVESNGYIHAETQYMMVKMDTILHNIPTPVAYLKDYSKDNYGNEELMRECLNAEEMTLNFSINTVIKNITSKTVLCGEFVYTNLPSEKKKRFYFDMERGRVGLDQETFTYLCNQRYEDLAAQMTELYEGIEKNENFGYQLDEMIRMGIGLYQKSKILTPKIEEILEVMKIKTYDDLPF